jgi:hypothetical protein
MAAGRQPDALDQAVAEMEVARALAADAGLNDVYAALVKAQLVLSYLERELEAHQVDDQAERDQRRAS